MNSQTWLVLNAVPAGSSRIVFSLTHSQSPARKVFGGSSRRARTVKVALDLSVVAAGYASVYLIPFALSKLMYSYDGPVMLELSGKGGWHNSPPRVTMINRPSRVRRSP